MVSIKNLSLSFDGKNNVLSNISYDFSSTGFYCIVGPSGCGKTTLLNCIYNSIKNYKGQIIYDNKTVKAFDENELNIYKLCNIGFIYQNFSLIENLTCKDNILLNFLSTQKVSKKYINNILKDVSEECNITPLLNQRVKNCSGGEKQRIAIARSIINSPSIILADEPTGNLDDTNSKNVFSILKRISKYRCVICVTHDYDLAKEFSDYIITMQDGEIINDSKNNHKIDEEKSSWRYKRVNKRKYITFPFKFMYRYCNETQKSHKVRSFIFNFSLIIGFVTSGFSLRFSNNITTQLKTSFSSMISENNIVASVKNEYQNLNNLVGASLNDITNIANDYPTLVDSSGYKYLVNFESFFCDRDEVYIASTTNRIKIPYFSIRKVDEYKTLNLIDNSTKFYPEKVNNFGNDEISLGLTFQNMSNICYSLNIRRGFDSLGKYLKQKETYIGIGVRNDNWDYFDDQYFKLVSVYESKENEIMHVSSNWNEYVFEELMRFPTSPSLNESFTTPWIMRKIPILRMSESNEEFLNEIMFDERYNHLLFDKDSSLYSINPNSNNVLVFSSDNKTFKLSDINLIKKICPELQDYQFSNDYTYMCLSNMLAQGFNVPIVFTSSKTYGDEVVDALSKEIPINEIEIPNNVAVGSILKSNAGGVKIKCEKNKTIYGRYPTNDKEIAISTNLLKTLNINYVDNDTKLYFKTSNSSDFKSIVEGEIPICGVVESSDNFIYGTSLFSYTFFRDYLNYSNLLLTPKNIIFYNQDLSKNNEILDILSNSFTKYSFSNPLLELSKTSEDTMKYIENLAFIFMGLSLALCFVLLVCLSYLDIIDKRKDIRMFLSFGYSKFKVSTLLSFNNLIVGSFASLSSMFALIIIDIMTSFTLSNYFGTHFIFNINILPIILICLIGVILSFIITKIITYLLLIKEKV